MGGCDGWVAVKQWMGGGEWLPWIADPEVAQDVRNRTQSSGCVVGETGGAQAVHDSGNASLGGK